MAANVRAVGAIDPPALDTPPIEGTGLYSAEVRGMTDRSFCFSERYGDQQGRADRTGSQPAILDFERRLVKWAFRNGIPLFAHTVNRGSQEQNRLFNEGKSRARAGESPHNYGAAVDIVHGTKGWALTRKQWSIIGHIGKDVALRAGLEVTWGGDWKFYDPAHWELTDWRAIRARYAGEGEDWDGR